MIRRDYLLHFLEVFSRNLARMLSLRQSGDTQTALELSHETLRYDEETRLALQLPLDDFLEHMEYAETLDLTKWSLVGAVLYQRGEIFYGSGHMALAAEEYIKALHVLMECCLSDRSVYRTEDMAQIRTIRNRLPEDMLPRPTALLLAEFDLSFPAA